MRLASLLRVVRTGTVQRDPGSRLLPLVATSSTIALVELVIRFGYEVRLPAAADLVLYLFESLVAVVFAVDIVTGFWVARPRRDFLRRRWIDLLLLPLVAAVTLAGVGPSLAAIARQAVITFRVFGRSRRWIRLVENLRRQPTQLLALSFFGLIAVGSLLLTFPAATADGQGATFVDALFTATSATCVTGLVVRDTGTYFSRFGQWVILSLIQLGGLGIMTFSASIMVLLGRRLGAVGRQAMSLVVEDSRDLDLAHSLRYILLFTLLAEAGGTAVLFVRWLGRFAHPLEALYHAAFHAVSAFCNAGFSTFADSLVRFQGDPLVNLVFVGLILVGGLGFAVVHEVINRATLRTLWERLFRPGAERPGLRLSTHAYLVLRTSAVLLLAGLLFFIFFEFDNCLAGMPLGTKLLAALFQAVTPRTAGFNTVPLDSLRPVTLLVVVVLMFIGASPGGTGGGIKTSTLSVLILTFRNLIAGRGEVEVRGRRVSRDVVYRATAITLGAAAVVGLGLAVLLVFETARFERLLFEAASAFATVGLSTGITSGLSLPGKAAIIVLMYVGRIGPLTLAFTMRARRAQLPVSYPEARVIVG
ncbi:hypothetical protein FJY69_03720 [candidate division WOR-3 bacterium]|nr:hypothetical protein [candidate division WOR-3 bacterium]